MRGFVGVLRTLLAAYVINEHGAEVDLPAHSIRQKLGPFFEATEAIPTPIHRHRGIGSERVEMQVLASGTVCRIGGECKTVSRSRGLPLFGFALQQFEQLDTGSHLPFGGDWTAGVLWSVPYRPLAL